MKRPFEVWIGFISICCSKAAKEGKVALGYWYYKELLKTLNVAQKLPSTIYLCLLVFGRYWVRFPSGTQIVYILENTRDW